jgi:hypothetical protein
MKKKPAAQPTDASVIQDLVGQLLKHAVLPKECGEIMDMTVDTVRNYCRRGRFAGAIQFGNEWLIPRATVDQYMEKRRGKTGNPNWGRGTKEAADET